MRIRDATVEDLPSIRRIYNALIETTTVAWSETLETAEQRERWFRDVQARDHVALVAEVDTAQGAEVVGFAAYGDFRGAGRWPGYRRTVEHTIHVDRPHWGSGVGRRLLEGLIERARAQGLHVMVGAIDGDNDDSIRFHERLGFVEVARMPQVGTKFGRWLDLVLVQRILDDAPPPVGVR